MSTPSLFDAEPKRSGNAKAFLIAVVVFVAVFGTAAGLYFSASQKPKPTPNASPKRCVIRR